MKVGTQQLHVYMLQYAYGALSHTTASRHAHIMLGNNRMQKESGIMLE